MDQIKFELVIMSIQTTIDASYVRFQTRLTSKRPDNQITEVKLHHFTTSTTQHDYDVWTYK